MKNLSLYIIVSTFILAGCGGGGGGGGSAPTPTTPIPTVNLSADPVSVLLEGTSTLTWSSTNATSCSASWTTQTSSSGSEAVTISTAGNNSFSITCSGAGGSRSATVTVEGYRNTDGVVVDGYISGAEVCIDEDESWTCDTNESSTTSDNDGKFTIKYANGNLVSIGGTDLDSQTLLDNLLITHKLTGHSDFKAVTPVTSVAAFMADASLVNAALGIDASIDVSIFDPVANKGDGGINDYLYEKGNQLTVLAYALQNITNNLNTTTETTQDYFKAITEEIEKEYTETETKVDIETESFIAKALDNIIEAKTVTISDDAKANTAKALSGVMPIIEVKSSDDLTTSVIRFAVSTLQTDIQAIANGTATAETVASYTTDVLTYIATDQNIDADEITPDINSIADSATTSEDIAVDINVLANDSFITTAPITVTAANGSNGSIAITANIVSYTSNADFNGTDTFSYTITQGDKTSSADVTVTIEAVNDAPTIDTASTIQAAENQTAVATISVSDVDEDDLTLTLSGTDADSFDLSTDNVLTFKEAPDFETKSSYSITLSLTDGIETVTKDVTIAVTNVNDVAPELTSEATFSAAENQTAIGTVTASDAEGDEITFAVSGIELAITSAGVLTFSSAPDYETKSSYTATITATDGINETTQDITVNVTNVNDIAPVFTSEATFSAAENQTAIGTVTAIDAEGDDVTFTVTGDELAITPSGVLTFISDPDFETKATYTAYVTVSDGINTVIQSLTVNVNDVNDYPQLLTSNNLYVDEGQINIVSLETKDDDGDDVVVSMVDQDDYEYFTLEPFTWNLSFKENSIPDYETKNSYLLSLKINDQNEGIVFEEINIIINDINEAPTLWCKNNLNQYRPSTSSCFTHHEVSTEGIQLNFKDEEEDSVTFQISGLDAAYFNLDSNSGLLTFIEQPDYETKAYYLIDISLSDGQNTSLYKDVYIQIINNQDEDLYLYTDSLVSNGSNIDIGYIPLLDPDDVYFGTDLSNLSYSIDNSLSTTDGDLFAIDDNGLLKFKNDPTAFESLKDLFDLTISVLQGEDLYKFVLKVKIINSEIEKVGDRVSVIMTSNSPESYISNNGDILKINSRESRAVKGGNEGVFTINADNWIEYDIAGNNSLTDGLAKLKGNAIYGFEYPNEVIDNLLLPSSLFLNLWNGSEFNKSSLDLNISIDGTDGYYFPKKDVSGDNTTIAYEFISDEPKPQIRVVERDSSNSLVYKGNIIDLQFPFEDKILSDILETFCDFNGGNLADLTLDYTGNTLAVLTFCNFSQQDFKNFGIDTDRGYSQYIGQYILFFDFEDGLWNQREFFFTPQNLSYPFRQADRIKNIKFSKDGRSLFAHSGNPNLINETPQINKITYANIWNWDGEAWLKSNEIPVYGEVLINEDFSSLVTYTYTEATYSEISGNSLNPRFFYKSDKRIWPNTSENGGYLAIEQLVQDDSSVSRCSSICDATGFIQVFDLDSLTADN
ncbi:Ig-like domain-containing protein [Gammaproteobacteria bacterium]|nr:Ig-like domain-containing protein [Gammaproteobacteria bacterium]